MKTLPLSLLFTTLLGAFTTGCATPAPDAATVTYFIDRTDFAGGDNGYAVPIATSKEGTLFASFSSAHRIEREPLDKLEKIDTGEGPLPLWSIPAPPMHRTQDWPSGHKPHLTLYPLTVPTVPLFIDDTPNGILPKARLEGHERAIYREGKHFPIILWERCDLVPGDLAGPLRFDPETAATNHGDSGVPRFVVLPDDSLAFLTMEIFRNGGGANHKIYLLMLEEAKKKDPSIEWKTVRWADVKAPARPN